MAELRTSRIVARGARPGRPRSLLSTLVVRAVQILAVGHALLLAAQPVLAGSMLDGVDGAVDVHAGMVGGTVLLLAMLLVPLTVLLWRPVRGPLWPVAAALGFTVLETLQVAAGQAGTMTVHLALGMSLLLAGIAFAVWAVRRL